mgnify:CR=1 FL=1
MVELTGREIEAICKRAEEMSKQAQEAPAGSVASNDAAWALFEIACYGVPKLLAHIDAQEKLLERAKEVLRMVQWFEWYAQDDEVALCPLCEQPEYKGHSPDCPIGAVLAERSAEHD